MCSDFIAQLYDAFLQISHIELKKLIIKIAKYDLVFIILYVHTCKIIIILHFEI
jgi:hypothetical protein